MNKLFLYPVIVCFLSVTTAAHATFIVDGTISGMVTSSSVQPYVSVGMSVSGSFSYDYDLLYPPDSSGDRQVAYNDLNASFIVQSSSGYGGAYGYLNGGQITLSSFQMEVGANGLPVSGTGGGIDDIGIGSNYVVLISGYNNGENIGWTADVTYTVTSMTPVPDAGATWFLLGIGLTGVIAFGRFFRRTPV